MTTEHPDHDPTKEELHGPTLADTDDPQDERGRIGYSRNERRSSWLLGLVLILVVVGIGAYQWMGGDDDDTGTSSQDLDTPLVGAQAPDFTLETFDGEEVTLSEQRGNIVILNFWGSWCDPCIREMPAFQRFWESSPDDVMMIGVGAKQDSMKNSREFAERFDITYPIGRDDGGDRVTTGLIAEAYQIMAYPMTFVISADGVISSLVLGEMHEEDLEAYVEKAREDSEAHSHTPITMNNPRTIYSTLARIRVE